MISFTRAACAVATAGEPAHRLTICQALLKGDALEEVVRQATEVGAARFRLVVTERCVVRDLPATANRPSNRVAEGCGAMS